MFAIVACLSRIRKLLETQRPESENIGNPAGICIFSMSIFWVQETTDIAFWMPLGASWGVLEASWGMMGASWAVFGGRPAALFCIWGLVLGRR